MTIRTVAFGLGGNVGDAAGTLRAAATALAAAPQLSAVAVSPLFVTRPVGGPPQSDFVNAVLVASSSAAPEDLLRLAQRVEDASGRQRSVRWGPRTLDVDVLAVGDVVRADESLVLPHPRAHERAFVLVPWACVDPDFVVPAKGRVVDLRDALSSQERAGVAELAGAPDWFGGVPA